MEFRGLTFNMTSWGKVVDSAEYNEALNVFPHSYQAKSWIMYRSFSHNASSSLISFE